jgi:uncharacterized membrane protein
MADQIPPGSPPPPPPGPDRPRIDIGLAISWAFDRFRSNAAAFVGLAAVVTVVQLVQQIGARPLQNILVDCSNPQTPGQVNACTAALGLSAIVTIVVALAFGLIALLAQIGVMRASVRSTQGIAPTFAEMFTTQYLGRFILFMVVFGIFFFIGLFLCILPGLAVLFFLQLGPYYILDKGMSVGEATRSSVQMVSRNLGPALMLMLINGLAVILGGMFFGILTLVTLPFATLFTAHMYRQFNDEPIV